MHCYLNCAAEGWPKAPGVIQAVGEALAGMSREPGRAAGEDQALPDRCRAQVARLLNAPDSNRIVFTLNATHALNAAILGLNPRPGSLVVTSANEHNSVLRPLERLRLEAGVRVAVVRCDARGVLDEDAFHAALREQPFLVALSHISNVTGHITDIQNLFTASKQAGARTVLDASQSAGHMDLNVDELCADVVAFNGHKGLHGPTGAGVLYVAPGLELRQITVGGTGARSDLPAHPPEMPMRLEAGTPNLAGLAGLEAALAWHEEHSADQRQRAQRRAAQLEAGLGEIPGLRLFRTGERSGGVFSFQLADWSVADLGYCLQESFGVVCRGGLHCAPLIHQALGTAPEGTVRFSVSGFSTEEEIAAAIDAVRRISGCRS